MNHLVNEVLMHWPCAASMPVNDVFDPLSLVKCLVLITCCWIFGVVQKLTNNAMEPKEIRFTGWCLFWCYMFSYCQVTSVITRNVQVTHCALSAKTVLALTELGIWQYDWWREWIGSTYLYIIVEWKLMNMWSSQNKHFDVFYVAVIYPVECYTTGINIDYLEFRHGQVIKCQVGWYY